MDDLRERFSKLRAAIAREWTEESSMLTMSIAAKACAEAMEAECTAIRTAAFNEAKRRAVNIAELYRDETVAARIEKMEPEG